jgi:hypothetical protein
MNIFVSGHASDALVARLHATNRAKHQKLAEKAWRSTHRFDERVVANRVYYVRIHRGNTVFRMLMGMIFVFVVDGETATLVTVEPPVNKKAWDRQRTLAKRAKLDMKNKAV